MTTIELAPAPTHHNEDPEAEFFWACPECPYAVLVEAGIDFDDMDGGQAEDYIDDLRASIDDMEGHPEKYLSLCGGTSMQELIMALRALHQGMVQYSRCYVMVD